MSFVNKKSVKEFMKSKEMRSSGELFAGVDKAVEAMLLKGIERANASKRKTVEPIDL